VRVNSNAWCGGPYTDNVGKICGFVYPTANGTCPDPDTVADSEKIRPFNYAGTVICDGDSALSEL